MKKLLFVYILSLSIFFSCFPSSEKQAEEIIASSISYHDPKSNWGNLERIVVENSSSIMMQKVLKLGKLYFPRSFDSSLTLRQRAHGKKTVLRTR